MEYLNLATCKSILLSEMVHNVKQRKLAVVSLYHNFLSFNYWLLQWNLKVWCIDASEISARINWQGPYHPTGFPIISQLCKCKLTEQFQLLDLLLLIWEPFLVWSICFILGLRKLLWSGYFCYLFFRNFCSDLSNNFLNGPIPLNFSGLPNLQRL